MTVHNFNDLRQHVGHKLDCIVYEDIAAGIEDSVSVECIDCHVPLVNFDLDDDCVEWIVYQLTIINPTGTLNFIFRDDDTAREQLYHYVFVRWVDEFPGEPCPPEHEKAILEYFHDNEKESYTLTEQPVLCEVEPI
jgi:hypothetical protein